MRLGRTRAGHMDSRDPISLESWLGWAGLCLAESVAVGGELDGQSEERNKQQYSSYIVQSTLE